MGNCFAVSDEEFYKRIKYERFLNKTNMNKKYQFKTKVYAKKGNVKTIEVYDMMFSKRRILKQVLNI